MRTVNPPGWPRPKGYANGIVAEGRVLFVAGQIGWTAEGRFEAKDFVGQFRQALENVVAVLAAGGASPGQVTRLTWYVTDLDAYRANSQAVGLAYRQVFGRHFPTMAVVGVAGLVEPEAMIEIEATAVLEDGSVDPSP